MSAPAPLRRAALHITLSLALGALTTIATAWACAAWSTLNPKSSSHLTVPTLADGSPDLQSLGLIAQLIDPDSRPRTGDAHGVSASLKTERGLGLQDQQLMIIYWSGGSGSGNTVVTLHRAGWPLPALRAACILRGNTWAWESSWSPPLALVRNTYPIELPMTIPRPPLPLRPELPAFIANSVFYACLWLLIPLAPVLRRHLRRRRGHCPRCNYDLRATPPDSPCPECGHKLRHS